MALTTEEREEIERHIRLAYMAGAEAVHWNWREDRDPDFSEAASDYVASLTLPFAASPAVRSPTAAEQWLDDEVNRLNSERRPAPAAEQLDLGRASRRDS